MTLLQGVSQIEQVAYGRTSDVSGGFPFCRVYLDGLDGEWEDQKSFFATYPFIIELIQELSAKSRPQAEADLEDLAYQVVRTLVTNWDVAGFADDSTIQSGACQEVNTPQGPAVSLKITFQVRSLIY